MANELVVGWLARKTFQAVLLIAVFTAVMFGQVAFCQDDRDLRSQIIDTWKERTAAVGSVRVAWVETSKGRSGDRTARSSVSRLVLTLGQNGKTRLERIGRDSTEGNDATGRSISSFDGRKNFNFTSASWNGDWPRGIVWADKNNDEIHNIQLRPWLIHCRPFGVPVPGVTADGITFRNGDATEARNGNVVVRMQAASSPVVGDYWLDAGRDFVVVKYAESANGRATVTLEIDYKADEDIGWIPRSWKARFENGAFSLSGNVDTFELNPEVPDSDFRIDYPEGTMVFFRDEGYRALLGPNGRRRIITPEESASGFAYEELLSELSADSSD